jgi:hypothetical protein
MDGCQSKMLSSKKIDLKKDIAAGDTVSHVGIFDPAL